MEKVYACSIDLRQKAEAHGARFVRGDQDVYSLDIRLTDGGVPFVIPDSARVYLTFSAGGVADKGEADIIDTESGHIIYHIIGSEMTLGEQILVSVEVVTDTQKLTFEQRLCIVSIDNLDNGGAEPPTPYKIWVDDITERVEQLTEFVESGEATQGKPGKDGKDGKDGENGKDGRDGLDGESAYVIAVDTGFVGTEEDWLASLVGARGADGADGAKGDQGDRGEQGVKGDTGARGEKGDTGSRGEVGADGVDGDKGDPGAPGRDGIDGADGTDGRDGVDGKTAFEAAQTGGYTGTEPQFNADLARMSSAITSNEITTNKVVTQAQYDAFRVLGGAEHHRTAYDIIGAVT